MLLKIEGKYYRPETIRETKEVDTVLVSSYQAYQYPELIDFKRPINIIYGPNQGLFYEQEQEFITISAEDTHGQRSILYKGTEDDNPELLQFLSDF